MILKGYRKLVYSPNPHLKARAQGYYNQFDSPVPRLIHSLRVLAPSEAVWEKADYVEERFSRYVREYTLGERIMQRGVTKKIKKTFRKRPQMIERDLPDPPWTITEFSGKKSEPRVVRRGNLYKHILKMIKVRIAMKFSNFHKRQKQERTF